MTFEQSLTTTATLIEQRLDDLLSGARMAAVPQRLVDAMRHAVLGGGKRFRPFLVLETARMLGGDQGAAMTVAAALECVHCYSLVHDDLPAMDTDRLRRGVPTVWAAYDEWTAILAGDALLTLAFELLAEPSAHPDPVVRAALISSLARAAGAAGMVGGQIIDLEADKLGLPGKPTLDHIRRLQAMKTGALIVHAVEAGAIVAGALPEQRRACVRYSEALGLAFQISDDLLDAEGDAAVVGKAVAKDAAVGKATLVGLMGLEPARAKLAQTVGEAVDALAPFGASAETLVAAARFMSGRRS